MGKVLLDEELFTKILAGDENAIKIGKDFVSNNCIIPKEIVEDAYENQKCTYDIDSVRVIYNVFGTSKEDFIKYLYELYEKNSDMFFISSIKDRKAAIARILRRYEYVRGLLSPAEVKREITWLNIDNHDWSDRIIKKYVYDEYYDKYVIEVISKICYEAENQLDLRFKEVRDFIELKPFNEKSYFILRYFAEFGERVIRLYFNKDKLFKNIFEIAAYLVKTNSSHGIRELEEIYVEELKFENNIENIEDIFWKNGICTISELQELISRDKIMSLEGMDVESARTIINALGKFYLDCNF